MSRTTAADRMRRVLAVVPWIVANPGNVVAEVAARFGLSEAELLADLNVVYMVGLPPYSPDALIDVQIDHESRVTISLADYFSRPLRLNSGQGLALLASSEALRSVPGMDADGALSRALDKLAAVIGIDEGDALDVHLGSVEEKLLEDLRRSAVAGTEVEMTYYSYGRDAKTVRRVAPWRVFADGGYWYLEGWCHTAEGERIFRVDRIEELVTLDVATEKRPIASNDSEQAQGTFHPNETDPKVRLRLAPEAAWVVDTYPSENVVVDDSGYTEATLVVTALPWLERLLVRLGSQVDVIEHAEIPEAASLARTAAERILNRYK